MTSTETKMFPVDLLSPHPENARHGDVEVIAGSIKRLGQYRPVIVNKGSLTGRPNEILAGHHIVKALISLGRPDALVHWVDVNEDDGRAILAVDNRAPELGDYDTEALYKLLSQIPDVGDLGYAEDDLADMRLLLEQSAEPVIVDEGPGTTGKPKFDFDPDRWAKADKRIMVLDMPVVVFIWVQERLAELAEREALASNLDVIVWLIQEASGQEAPRPEDIPLPDEA